MIFPANRPTPPVPLARFFYLTFVAHILVAVPFIGIVWATAERPFTFLGFLVGPFLVLGVPIIATICWLVAKGSNWSNTRAAAAYAVGHSMPTYVLLAAFFVVVHFRGVATWWVLVAILVIVAYGRMRLFRWYAGLLLRWLAPDLALDQVPTTA